MKLFKRLNEDKNLANYIQNKLRTNKSAYMGKGINVKLILNNRRKMMNKFISRNKGLQNEYKEIKAENQNFSNTYKFILNVRDKQDYLEKTFKDNFVLYQKKGYKIPNLTTKSNIIKYSPLLMEGQEHINKFFLQDLYSLNKKLKKIWKYDQIQKYITNNNINFNGNSEDEDDDNEKEGLNSNFFLNKCDLLAKKAYKEIKEKRAHKSLDVNNWFKKDLYADPFLTQGNSINDDSFYKTYLNDKKNMINKEIEKLVNYNDKIKKEISKINDNDLDEISNKQVNKRHSVLLLRLNEMDNKMILSKNHYDKCRSKSKKQTILLKTNFEKYYHNTISSKLKKNEEKISTKQFHSFDIKNTKSSLKSKLFKTNILKKDKKKSFVTNKNTKRSSNSNVNENLEACKKKFHLYSGKSPNSLLSLIYDIKEPFNRPNILNIFSKKFMLSKIRDINLRYSILEKYLCKGLLANDFST